MSRWDASFFEVPDPEELWRQRGFDPLDLDDATADRILDGLDPDDAPPGYVNVSRLLMAATAPSRPDELNGQAAAVAVFTLENLSLPPSKHSIASRASSVARNKLSSLAVAGGLVLGGGMAAAATGALHGSVQRVETGVLSVLGIDATHSHHGHHGAQPGTREKPATRSASMQTSPVPQRQDSVPGPTWSSSTRAPAAEERMSSRISTGSGTLHTARGSYRPTERTVRATAPRGSGDATNSYTAYPRGGHDTKTHGPGGKGYGPNGPNRRANGPNDRANGANDRANGANGRANGRANGANDRANGPNGAHHPSGSQGTGAGAGAGANHPPGPQGNGPGGHTTGSGSSQPKPGAGNTSQGGPAGSADPPTANRDLTAVTGQYAAKPGRPSTPASTSPGLPARP